MSKIIQGVVLTLNFIFCVLLCYLYDTNKWITDDPSKKLVQTEQQYEGFWRICTVLQSGATSCEKYKQAFFDPQFPGWILAGRIMLGLAVLLGFVACLGLLLGSDIATAISNRSTKKTARLVSAILVTIAGALTCTTGLYVFIMMVQNQHAQYFFDPDHPGRNHAQSIPTTATYSSAIMGGLWVVTGLVGLFCSGSSDTEDEGMEMYRPGQHY